MAENGALSPKQKKAIAALMQAKDTRAAALACKVGERTLYRWLQCPAFQAELKRAGQASIDAAIRRLSALTGQACDVLESEMADQETPASVRVRAADIVLSRLLNLKELCDLEARISKLEEEVKQ